MKRIAIIVGVNSYKKPITTLKCAEHDAADMYALFKRLPGYADVSHFTGTTAQRADEVRRGIERKLGTVGPGDLAVLYFAGHGTMKKVTGEQLLLFPDADVDNLDYYTGAIVLEQIKRVVRKRGCNCLIVLDACRNSLCDNTRAAVPDGKAGFRDLNVSTKGFLGFGSSIVPDLAIYYGCQEGKCSVEGEQHGRFTEALIAVMEEALKANREVRFDEAFRRAVFDKMIALGNGAVGDDQRPTPYGDLLVPLVEVTGMATPPPVASNIPFVSCSKCGRYKAISEMFKCRICGTDHLCLSHYDQEYACCDVCAAKMRTEKPADPIVSPTPANPSPPPSPVPESSNVPWEYRKVGGEVIIEKVNMNPHNGVLVIPSQLEGCPVTIIGKDACSYRSKLTSAVIPEGVVSIRKSAFGNCYGLMSVTIPSSVTNIGDSAFSDCSGLTSVTLPSSVTSIGKSAFSGCNGLVSMALPSSLTSIGNSAFSGCGGLKSVTIPSSVTRIGEHAFYACKELMSVEIPEGVTVIRNSTFKDCCNLKSVTIPSSVERIENDAFSGCSCLRSVVIPSSVMRIGANAFYGCRRLRTVYVEPGDGERMAKLLNRSDEWNDFGSINIVERE